eukprot:7361205-Pyramimonas_sp.AAC.1
MVTQAYACSGFWFFRLMRADLLKVSDVVGQLGLLVAQAYACSCRGGSRRRRKPRVSASAGLCMLIPRRFPTTSEPLTSGFSGLCMLEVPDVDGDLGLL